MCEAIRKNGGNIKSIISTILLTVNFNDPHIQFTFELDKNYKLLFFDVLVTSFFETCVYRNFFSVINLFMLF